MMAPLWLVGTALLLAPISPNLARTKTPFIAQIVPEATLSLGIFATTAIINGAVKRTLGGSPPCRTLDGGQRCDPQALWAIDRASLTLHDHAWSVVSDVGQGLALGGSAVMVLADALAHHGGAPYHDGLTEATVLVESVAVSTAIGQLVKFAVRRPRPQLYLVGTARGVEAELSFPSGHTAATAAALTAWATIFQERHKLSTLRYLPYGLSFVVTGLVAYGRIATPKHFATDVLAGAVLGASIGLAVPLLHLRPGNSPINVTAQPVGAWAPGRTGAVGVLLQASL